jgi:Flp pilus assembly secretin CpaC
MGIVPLRSAAAGRARDRRSLVGRLLLALWSVAFLLASAGPVRGQPGGPAMPPGPPAAPGAPRSAGAATERVEVTMGASTILEVPGQLERASVTNPEVANIQVIPPNQVLVNGKTPGTTTVITWANGERRYFDVVVKADVALLQQALRQIAPDEPITTQAVQTSVVLSGTVSTPAMVARAAEVARAFLPEKATVVNLIRLAAPHQILLKVDVAEINRSALRELGLDFINLGTVAVAVFGATTAGLLGTTLDKDGVVSFDNRTSVLFAHNPSGTRALLRAFEQKGLVKSLAGRISSRPVARRPASWSAASSRSPSRPQGWPGP